MAEEEREMRKNRLKIIMSRVKKNDPESSTPINQMLNSNHSTTEHNSSMNEISSVSGMMDDEQSTVLKNPNLTNEDQSGMTDLSNMGRDDINESFGSDLNENCVDLEISSSSPIINMELVKPRSSDENLAIISSMEDPNRIDSNELIGDGEVEQVKFTLESNLNHSNDTNDAQDFTPNVNLNF